MLHGFYENSAPELRLRSLGALLRQDPDRPDHYVTQFDALHLPEAFGWHSLPKRHFTNIEGGEI